MKLFISYARVDKPSCEPIIHELEKAHEVFYDQRLHVGERWQAEIEGRVAWCEGFVYMLSPESVASEYCQWELGLARAGGKLIFPVLLQARTSVPDELLEIQIADFSDGLTAQAFSDLSAGIHRAEVDRLRQMIPRPETLPAAPQVDSPHGPDVLTVGSSTSLPLASPKPAPTQRGFPFWVVGVLGLVIVLGLTFAFWPRGDGASEDSAAAVEPTEVPSAAFEAQEPGTLENPITWSFYLSNETEQVAAGAQQLADLLLDETGLYFQTNVTNDPAALVEAMCSDPLEVQMASLPLFGYLLAAERGCAEAALVTVRFDFPAYNGQIITHTDSGISSVADLAGKTFCRPDPLSISGWIIPSLTMRAAGLNPDTDLGGIVDMGPHPDVVAAVYNGDCDAGATYVDARETVEGEYPDVMDVVVVIEVTADIPNDGVQFSPGMPQALRDKVVTGLLAIADTEEGGAALDAVYTYTTSLEAHGDDFYDPLRQMLQTAGLSAEDYLE